jgi:divalent metal cation (Fe/Co/Zn/Cd) transporter
MLKIDEAHERTRELELEITRKIPAMDMVIHIEPCEESCENTLESCKINKKISSGKTFSPEKV